MSKNTRNTPAPVLKQAIRKALLTNTGLVYLKEGFAKITEPLHPNFKRALKQASLETQQLIRLAANQSWDANPENPKQAVIDTGKRLKHDARAYIQFYKDLMGNCAFLAHMDCVALERKVDPEQLDMGLDAMGDEHPGDVNDLAIADATDLAGLPEREAYAGSDQPEPRATSVEDAEYAIKGLQAWIGLSVNGMDSNARQYWGVDGLFPLGTQTITHFDREKEYLPIQDFNDYREYQTAEWKRKRRAVPLDAAAEDLMAAG